MKRFIILLVFLSLSFSACDPLSGIGQDWWMIISLLIYVDIFLLAILYMIGKVFNNPYYLAFVKDELGQLILTAFLVVAMQGLFVGICSLLVAYSQEHGISDHITYSLSFLKELKTQILVDIDKLYDEYVHYNIEGGFWLSRYDISGQGVTISPNAWMLTIADLTNLLISILSSLYASIALQEATFKLFVNQVIPVLIPAAIIARLIPQLREAGNLLLAVAISFYIVLPFVYSLMALSYEKLTIDYTMDDAFWGNTLVEIAKYLPYAVFFPQLAFGIAVSTVLAIRKIFSYGVVI